MLKNVKNKPGAIRFIWFYFSISASARPKSKRA